MEASSQSRNKEPIANKTPNSYPFKFLHLEVEKPPLNAGDIWVPILLISSNRCVKIFIPGMEKWFQLRDKLVKVEHVGVISRLVSWLLKINQDGSHQWIEESEDHVDLCVYPHIIQT
jgi:hypothetical protein